MLPSETFVLAIPSRTDDNPDTRVQRPMARPPFSNLLGSLPVPQVTPSTTARFQTASFGTLSSQSETSNYLPTFAEPPRWHYRAALSLDMPQHGQKALKEP